MKRVLILILLFLVAKTVQDAGEPKGGTTVAGNGISGHMLPRDTLKIVAAGDVMLGTMYPDSSFLPEFNPVRLFKPLQRYLRGADICFANLEGVLTDDMSQAKTCVTEDRCYYFAMPTDYGASLKAAGFNVLSLANNHLNDFGYIGRKSTRATLRRLKIHYAGMLEAPFDTFSVAGVKYGFCAFSPNAGMTSIKDLGKAARLVQKLDSMCDVVLVSFHAGAEGSDVQHVTRKKEFYIGEDRGNVYEFAHRMIDAGGDILLGHGPHVTRAVEVYKDRFIAYSLGNFCTWSRVSVAGRCGEAPLMHIYTDRKGRFLCAQVIPTFQQKYKAPDYDVQLRAVKQIQQLTKVDFPEMARVIRISDSGMIERVDSAGTPAHPQPAADTTTDNSHSI